MDYATLRRLSLKTFIAFLILTALIAIVSVLVGEMGKLQFKILATTFTISVAGVLSMIAAAFIESRGRTVLGLVGLAAAGVAAVLFLVGVWAEMEDSEFWKTTGTAAVITFAFSQSFLLSLPRLDERQNWVQPVTVGTIGLLAAQIIGAIWGETDSELYVRLLTVVAILVGLETIVIPILMKLRKGGEPAKRVLVLERIDAETFRDSNGERYRVEKLDPGVDVPTKESDGH